MTILHHPGDALLLALAAGNLARGTAVVTAAHAQGCPRCLARLRDLEAVGGVLLDEIEPAALAAEALLRTLARIDALGAPSPLRPPTAAAGGPRRLRASLPAGVAWPRSLGGSTASGWRRLGPGVRWSRVTLAGAADANVYLLRVAAGKALPVHGHRGGELTHVLHGAFHAGGEHFAAGDFAAADDGVHHQPVATADGECICLTSVEGRIAFDGPIGRVLGSLFGM